jgi:hypothetical protein
MQRTELSDAEHITFDALPGSPRLVYIAGRHPADWRTTALTTVFNPPFAR